MKQELFEKDTELVTGGTVVFSDRGFVGFSTTGERYVLQGVDWRTARNFVEDLVIANPQMSDADFDQYAKGLMAGNGWLGQSF